MSPERKNTPASKKAEKGEGKTLTLKYVKSKICTPKDQKRTIQSLGFRRLGQEVVRKDDPAIRGMILKVRHLVEIVKD